jgi:DNA-binding transcriptional LysR family regulator
VETSCLIVRADHPLLELERPGLEDLRHYEWVFQPQGSLLRRSVERSFLEANLPVPQCVVSTPSVLVTAAMVVRSNAIAPIAREVADFIIGTSGQSNIVMLETDLQFALERYSLITARNRGLPPSARLLHDLIAEENGRDQPRIL